jgi:hypothetical protein
MKRQTTLGYLVGVMTILSIVIQPRAKFLQAMLMQVLLSLVACAFTLLACYCCVQARQTTDNGTDTGSNGGPTSGLAASGAQTTQYNSSASAVAGIFLFVQIYAISVLRARLPQYTIATVMYAVFANVSMTYAPQFASMSQAKTLAVSILKAYLTAFAISTGVSLLVFPQTSRVLVFNDMRDFIQGFRSALKANLAYLDSLEQTDMFAAQKTNSAGQKPERSPEADVVVKEVASLSNVQGKCAVDLTFAKREIAIGKMGPDDLQEVFRRLRECMVPVMGLSCMSDIFERTAEEREWDRSVSFAAATLADATNDTERSRIQSINEWHELISLLKEPFGSITNTIDDGFEHVLIILRLNKKSKTTASNDDHEAAGDQPRPGEYSFTQTYRRKIEEFQKSKEIMLRGWCVIHGIELPEDFFSNPSVQDFEAPKWMNHDHLSDDRRRLRRQLMIMLYIESLLYYTARRLYNLLVYVDQLRDSGKLNRSRLVVPGVKRIRKWFYSSLLQKDDIHDADAEEFDGHNYSVVELGQAYKSKLDPEHLTPQTTWEMFSDNFRKISHFFGSPASHFGFRVAVAVMAIAVINLLHTTQVFFTRQRLFWAQIMISIGMAPSAGLYTPAHSDKRMY